MTRAQNSIPGTRLNELADQIEEQYLQMLDLQRSFPDASEQERVLDEARKFDDNVVKECERISQAIEQLKSRLENIRKFVHARPVQPNIKEQWERRQQRATELLQKLNTLIIISKKEHDKKSEYRYHEWQKIQKAYDDGLMQLENKR